MDIYMGLCCAHNSSDKVCERNANSYEMADVILCRHCAQSFRIINLFDLHVGAKHRDTFADIIKT